MDKQLTLDELKEMHGKPVWCRIPSDNPRWGIVDAESSCVVLGANHRLIFYHYGEWKAFTSPDPTPSPTIKPGDKVKIISALAREWIGREAVVTEVYTEPFLHFSLDIGGGHWTPSCLEVIESD